MNAPPKKSAAAATAAPPSLVRYRLDVALRVVAATGVNYAVCAMFAVLAALGLAHLGVSRVDAVIGSITLAFLLFATVAVWVFASARAWPMWRALLIALGALAALSAWLAPELPQAPAPAAAQNASGPQPPQQPSRTSGAQP